MGVASRGTGLSGHKDFKKEISRGDERTATQKYQRTSHMFSPVF
jgi:hypothetical protein